MNIAFFSAVRYDSVIGGRTRRLEEELAHRHAVHFVEMPSLRHPCLCRKISVSSNVSRYQLMPMPHLWRSFASGCGQWWIRYTADFLNRNLPPDTQAVVSTPFWTPVLKKLKLQSITYDCLDHISVQAPGAVSDVACSLEKELLDMADRVVCVSGNLADAMREKTQKAIHVISNGFPAEYLSEPVKFPKTPTAGFCGAMYEWFDFRLVKAAAEALPDVHFILTGPVRDKKNLRPLHDLANVEINPAIPFELVKSEIARYSVGMIPFKRDTISHFCNPIKMYEYSALGKAVVSTVKGAAELPLSFTEDNARYISELDRIVHTPGPWKFDRSGLAKYAWNNIAANFERVLK